MNEAIKQVHPTTTLRDLMRMAQEFFTSRAMRRQWVRKTWWLLENEKHACQTGSFKPWSHEKLGATK